MSRLTLAVAFVALVLAIGVGLMLGPKLSAGTDIANFLGHAKPELPPRPVDQIVDEMKLAEKKLDELYVQARSSAADTVVERVERFLRIVNDGYEELGRTDNLPQEVEVVAQMTILRSHFLASKVIPSCAPEFEALAEQVIEIRPDSNDAVEAHILRFCHEHHLHKPMRSDALTAIEEMATSFNLPWYGIMAYSVVASELWSNGQPESAEQVLTAGITKYKGQNGQSYLVHQLVDQGHRPPPKPTITQEQFKALMRASASFASSRSTGPRCPKFR